MTSESESGLILPPDIVLPKQIQPKEAPDSDATNETKASALPRAVGHKLVCIVPEVSDKIEGTELDLVRDYSTMKQEEHATTVLFVLRMGPDAYQDKERFPSGPWCAEGDFIVVRTYTGTRLKVFGKEFRIINDDQVDCVVDDPRGITRA